MVELFGSVLSDESSSDWSWTRSVTVLDLPADLISLLLYMLPFTEGSHVFWDTTCFFSTFPFNCSLHSPVLYDVTLGPLTPVIKPIKFRTLFLDLCHSLCTSEASLCEVNLLLCEHVLHGSCDYLDLN